jgi:hypothetical protein
VGEAIISFVSDASLKTYWRSLQSLRRDLVVDCIGGDLDIPRSTLLQNVR